MIGEYEKKPAYGGFFVLADHQDLFSDFELRNYFLICHPRLERGSRPS